MTVRIALVFFLFTSLLLSCQGEKKPDPAAGVNSGERYFSLYQLAQDQWEINFRGQPLVFQRIVTAGGRADTSYVSLDTLHWDEVLPKFLAADISDRKYLGRYRYSQLDEPMLGSKTLMYDAKEADLFTRSMQINVDGYSSRLQSVLIKTRDSKKEQMLLYVPTRLIQIQESGKSAAQNTLLEYRMEMDEGEPGIMMSDPVDSLNR